MKNVVYLNEHGVILFRANHKKIPCRNESNGEFHFFQIINPEKYEIQEKYIIKKTIGCSLSVSYGF